MSQDRFSNFSCVIQTAKDSPHVFAFSFASRVRGLSRHSPSPLDLELTSSSGLSWIVSARRQPEDYETETSGVGVKRKDTRSPYSYVLQGSCVLRCCCGQVRFPVVCRFRCLQCFFPNRGCGRMHSNHQCNPAHSTLHAQKRS